MAEFTEDEIDYEEYGYKPMTLGARPNTGAYVNSRGRHTGPTLLTGASSAVHDYDPFSFSLLLIIRE